MSKKKTIKDKEKELQQREEQVKQELDSDSGELREKLIRAGKIAAISGAVALLGYWAYRSFFSDEDTDEEAETKKPKVQKKKARNISAAISAALVPYLEKTLAGVFDEKKGDKKDEKDKEDKSD